MKGKIIISSGIPSIEYKEQIKSPEGYAEKTFVLPISVHNNASKYEVGDEVDFEIIRDSFDAEAEIPVYFDAAFIYTNLIPASSWEEIWKEWAEKHNGTMSFLVYLINNFQIPKRKL